MLPPFIIDQIRQREEAERRRDAEQPRLEVPLDYPTIPAVRRDEIDDVDRGVVIIEL